MRLPINPIAQHRLIETESLSGFENALDDAMADVQQQAEASLGQTNDSKPVDYETKVMSTGDDLESNEGSAVANKRSMSNLFTIVRTGAETYRRITWLTIDRCALGSLSSLMATRTTS